MDDDPSVIYGLDFQARCLTSVQAEGDTVQFVVGTQTLKSDNQVCVLELEEDSNQVSKHSYAHKAGEIWHLSASPDNSDVIATCYSKVHENRAIAGCSVWRMNESTNDLTNLEKVCEFKQTKDAAVTCFDWQPSSSSSNKAFALHGNNISIVDSDFDSEFMKVISSTKIESKSACKLLTGRWNPHHNSNVLAVSGDATLRGYDIRSMKSCFTIENAHIPVIRYVDFNPNRQYMLATAGDDCRIRFWDSRNTEKPLAVLGEHSHWVWSVCFNPIHDQLLLSCSSDARLVLHCQAELSSEPQGVMEDDDTPSSPPVASLSDGVIRVSDEHEESIYSCCWCQSDPWIYASLSYDGRLCIGRVPKRIKYTILQL